MIHNIFIATVYDVIILSDDVSIYLVDLFKEIVTFNTIQLLKEMQSFQAMIFFSVVFRFGNSFMATECR